MQDQAHIKLRPLEFEDFKKAANVWYLESKFEVCASEVQAAYAAKVFEPAFWEKIKAKAAELVSVKKTADEEKAQQDVEDEERQRAEAKANAAAAAAARASAAEAASDKPASDEPGDPPADPAADSQE